MYPCETNFEKSKIYPLRITYYNFRKFEYNPKEMNFLVPPPSRNQTSGDAFDPVIRKC